MKEIEKIIKFKNISRAVLLRNMPHFAFIRRNTYATKKFRIK